MSEIVIYRAGLVHLSVCAPNETPVDDILAEADREHPTGLEHGWHRLRPGRYLIEGWCTPFYWAGSEPVDADGGLTLLSAIAFSSAALCILLPDD